MSFPNKNDWALNPDELERYSRHILLSEIGEEGQAKLKKSSVLCIGCGGLGSPLLIYLAAAGIGHIGIVDSDSVEKSNLQRQIIHGTNWIGKAKTDSARARINSINPNCNVQIFNTLLTNKNAFNIIKLFDVICDCTDNFESRYLINDACVILSKPIVYGAISKFEGQATVFNLRKDSPNFRDLIPTPPPKELLPTCSQSGVMGVLPGLIGVIQATEVVKIITDIGESLDGRILIFDALKMIFKELKLFKNINRKPIKELIDYEEYCSSTGIQKESSIIGISVNELKILLEAKPLDILLIDIRPSLEFKLKSIYSSISIPYEDIQSVKSINKLRKLSENKQIYVHCEKGITSKKAILILEEYGISAKNIDGGMEAWEKLELSS